MARDNFNVSILPSQVVKVVNEKFYGNVLDTEFYKLENDKSIYIITYEKYFIRTNSNGAVILICDDTTNITKVKLITSGTGTGLASIDFGAANNLISSIREILDNLEFINLINLYLYIITFFLLHFLEFYKYVLKH
jgi:hypothetical protein